MYVSYICTYISVSVRSAYSKNYKTMWRLEFHATDISHSSAQACEWNATELGESKYPARQSNLKHAGSSLLDLLISSQNELHKKEISF